MRWIVLLIVIAIGGSLLGANEAVGIVVLFGGLVLLIGYTLKSGRPRGGTMRSHKVASLGWFRGLDPGDLPAMFLAGFAAGQILTAFDASVGAALVAAVVVGVSLAFVPGLGDVLGGIAVLATLATIENACDPATGGSSVGRLLVTLLVALAAFAVARVVGMGTNRLVSGHIGIGGAGLLLFGLVELALFVSQPNGLSIWSESTNWAFAASLALTAAIAAVSAWAPKLMLALVSVGVLAGSLAITAAAVSVESQIDACGSEGQALVVAAAVVTAAGLLGNRRSVTGT